MRHENATLTICAVRRWKFAGFSSETWGPDNLTQKLNISLVVVRAVVKVQTRFEVYRGNFERPITDIEGKFERAEASDTTDPFNELSYSTFWRLLTINT